MKPDTCGTKQQYQTEYYNLVYSIGKELVPEYMSIDSLNAVQQYELFNKIYAAGRKYVEDNSVEYGKTDSRPTDRRENYVKRCVGLPGQTLQIKNRIVYLNGKANKEPDNVQYTYYIKLLQTLPDDFMKENGISMEDLTSLSQNGYMPLTNAAKNAMMKRKDLVASIKPNIDASTERLYPLNMRTGWTSDNYGPIWIPKKGASIKLDINNIAIYERPIRVYEKNDLQVKNGKILMVS